MDRLQSWFDGGDWFTLGLGLLSLGAAIWTLFRQGRIDRDNLKLQSDNLELQRRLMEIEEARRNEEIKKTSEADIRVKLRTTLDSNRRNWQTTFTIENQGGALAENVTVEEFVSVGAKAKVDISQLPGSIPSILPGDRATYTTFISMGAGDVFAAKVSWDDPRGSQTRTFSVTRERQ